MLYSAYISKFGDPNKEIFILDKMIETNQEINQFIEEISDDSEIDNEEEEEKGEDEINIIIQQQRVLKILKEEKK